MKILKVYRTKEDSTSIQIIGINQIGRFDFTNKKKL